MNKTMMLVATVVMALAGGCCVDPPEPTTERVSSADGCIWAPDRNGLACVPESKDGCVCGQPAADGTPPGSCHLGGCCQGCWSDNNECLPGDGSRDGRGVRQWGARGTACSTQPTN